METIRPDYYVLWNTDEGEKYYIAEKTGETDKYIYVKYDVAGDETSYFKKNDVHNSKSEQGLYNVLTSQQWAAYILVQMRQAYFNPPDGAVQSASQEGAGRKRRRKKTRKRKSRKRRKSRRKKRKTNKRKMRKNKKTRKRKQKGRGANICKMISDPDKKNELKVMALSRAKRARRLRLALHPETGKPLTSLLSMLEAHNYCQEMNNDNYRCDPGSGMCEKVDSEAAKNVINGMLSGRGFK